MHFNSQCLYTVWKRWTKDSIHVSSPTNITHRSITFNVWLQQMPLELVRSCKTFSALTTWVRLCTSVNTNTTLQMMVCLKRLPTVRTEIWSTVAMYMAMCLQFAGLTESFVTQWTHVRFVSRVNIIVCICAVSCSVKLHKTACTVHTHNGKICKVIHK